MSGVLRTELDVGEHAQAAELRGQRTAHARLAQVHAWLTAIGRCTADRPRTLLHGVCADALQEAPKARP